MKKGIGEGLWRTMGSTASGKGVISRVKMEENLSRAATEPPRRSKNGWEFRPNYLEGIWHLGRPLLKAKVKRVRALLGESLTGLTTCGG